MKEKNISNKYGERIVNLIESWEIADELFSELQYKSIKWLTNFNDDEIDDAFKLLSKIEVISSAKIHNTINKLSEVIRTRIGIENLVIASLEGIGGSSGSQFLYQLQKALVMDNIVRTGRIEDIVSTNKKVVLIDDIVGSGGEAITTWEKIKDSGSDIYYCPLFCFEEGNKNIKELNCFTAFFPQHILEENYSAFSEQSKYFPNNEERNRLKQLATSYGKRLFSKYPLGYGNTQALFAWGTTLQAPNNSLPIIWAGPKNESEGFQWNPLFERIKVKNVIPKSVIKEEVNVKEKSSTHPKSGTDIFSQVNNAISLHEEGKIIEYRLFVYRNKLSNQLKRTALFDRLRDLAYLDLDSSLNTRFATSVLSYIQSCLVLCELESAIKVIHKKLVSDPHLKTYTYFDKVEFLRTYAEILSALDKNELSISLVESILSDGVIINLPHNRLSHLQSALSTFYLSVGRIEDAYELAQAGYDEQILTTNNYGKAISSTRLGIVLLEMKKEKDAITLFESAISFFKDFDLRACAWAQIYCHVSALRLGETRIDYFKSAMLFYSKHNYATKETLLLLKEARSSGIGWSADYDNVIDNFSIPLNKSKVSTEYFNSAETLCNILISKLNTKGANAVNNSVTLGEFRQTSILTKSFLKSLNEDSKQEYLNKIACTDKFYLSPFYNNFIRHSANLRPDLIKKIIIPKINEIISSRDTFRLFYARFLEKNGFYKEADLLLESIKVKNQFRYFNNKANVLSHKRTRVDEALEFYIKAIDIADNDHEKSIAYHNQALLILKRKIIERYDEAESLCMRAIELRFVESFWYPFQTIILLRIDKESIDKTSEILSKCQNEFKLPRVQLRQVINEIKDMRKYAKADKYFLENYLIKPLTF